MNTNPPTKLVVDKDHPLTINSLKAAGYKVSAIHYRMIKMPLAIKVAGQEMEVSVQVPTPIFEIRRKDLRASLLAKGGYTVITVRKNNQAIYGESFCHDKDIFNNKLGITKALYDVLPRLAELDVIKPKKTPAPAKKPKSKSKA